MPEYRCFMRSRAGHLLQASVTCRDEDHARDRAAAWLTQDVRIGSIEVWDDHPQIAMAERSSDRLPDGVI